MKFNFPKIVKAFSLAEYAPELQESIFVWVNPSTQMLKDLSDTFQAYLQDREKIVPFMEAVSVLLSQGDTATHWSVDELLELKRETEETDPAFWMWINNRILQEITEHRLMLKKN